MKRSEFIRQLTHEGCTLYRHGSRHDIYINPATGHKQSVPWHTEIDDALEKHIKKYLGLKV